VSFKPAYDKKQISSFRVKGGQSQTIAWEVNPAKEPPPAPSPLWSRFSSGEKKAEANSRCTHRNIFKLDAGTPTGLLSLDAFTGETSIVSCL